MGEPQRALHPQPASSRQGQPGQYRRGVGHITKESLAESKEGKTRVVRGGTGTARTKTELQKLSEVVPLISSVSHNAGANVTGMHEATPEVLGRKLPFVPFSKQLHSVARGAEQQLQVIWDAQLSRCSTSTTT